MEDALSVLWDGAWSRVFVRGTVSSAVFHLKRDEEKPQVFVKLCSNIDIPAQDKNEYCWNHCEGCTTAFRLGQTGVNLKVKMWTQALFSLKVAQTHYYYGSLTGRAP